MKKYLRIYKRLLENALSYQAQRRGDTWMKLFLNILWIGMLFLFINVFFEHTQSFAGWSKEEVYLLTFFWICIDEIMILFFEQNLTAIPDIVTDGGLDLYLTKPVNTLFLVSTQKVLLFSLYRLILEGALLLGFLTYYPHLFSIWQFIFAIPLFLCGIMTTYAFLLLLNTLSFWFFRIDNVNDLWLSIANDVGKYPIDALPRSLRTLFLTLIPVAFAAYVPTATLLGKISIYGILYALIFALGILVFALSFWRFSVKRYSSASS